MGKTKIEWSEMVWNPIRGCTRVSEGCRNCYAERVAARFSGLGEPYHGLAILKNHQPRWTGKVRFIEKHLEDPWRWKKPRMIFVNSMSDLFHEQVSDGWIAKIIWVMSRSPRHIFQILTKRPERMRDFLQRKENWEGSLRNIWWGVSVEDQKTADERIPLLLETPVAIRWVSYEPALGPLKLTRQHEFCPIHSGFCMKTCPTKIGIDWLVCGGESGPGARPMHPDWARNIRNQCFAMNIPFFFKQWGEYDAEGIRTGKKSSGDFLDGHQWRQFPPVLKAMRDVAMAMEAVQSRRVDK